MKSETNRALNRALIAGTAGGAMEVLWIGLITAVFGIEMSQVARAVATTVIPISADSWAAPWIGLIVHFLLSAALALVFARTVAKWLHGAVLTIAAVVALTAVWAFNFLVLLPVLNPALAVLLPYPVTLLSKLLFGLAMAWVLDRDNAGPASN